jgi:glycosyltransferase involved in cell wall biosynthesis
MPFKTSKIVLITSGQPSINPRLVKEADALYSAGYDVTVLYQYWNAWATEMDKHLMSNRKWKAVRVGGSPSDGKLQYLISRLAYKAIKLISGVNGLESKIMQAIIGKGALLLTGAAKRHPANFYLAHNLAALPAAVMAAKWHGVKCGFDAEDFHRFELTDDIRNTDVQLKILLEDKFIPQVHYFTASSSYIANLYRQLYPALKPVVIKNVFPRSNLGQKDQQDGGLKLFWFSQTIGYGRGIETAVKALKILNDKSIELHLLGEHTVKDYFIVQLLKSGANIKCHNPVEPDLLINFASQFDIGLAMEDSVPLNRNICLTNKIFTYPQAGLAVVASDTLAQQNFMETYPEIGMVYQKGNAQSLVEILNYYLQNRAELINAKRAALRLAHEHLNWELESKKFIAFVKQTLAD